ncbi:MAG: 2-phospho-L-lactate transferase [Actinomycetales bacterium]|nr:2-phospho-L-lactate transferase [Actinomycetales bacterium]
MNSAEGGRGRSREACGGPASGPRGAGVGGARFLLGVREWARAAAAPTTVTAVVNVGDDLWLSGLRVCPDLDSVMYALAGVNDAERGWGRAGERERVAGELAAYGTGWPWFTLGDLDLGTHIARTGWLHEGLPLSEATRRLAARWDLGVELLPASDDPVETHVVTDAGELHFEEWWTRHRGTVPARRFVQHGVELARPGPGVLAAIAETDLVLLAPSNPVVSIGTILGIDGIREAVRATAAPVVGVSPIIGGAVVRGMADACLEAIGVETSARAVGAWYGARSSAGLLDGWLVGEEDAEAVPALEAAGLRAASVPLWMRDPSTTARMVEAAVALARRD